MISNHFRLKRTEEVKKWCTFVAIYGNDSSLIARNLFIPVAPLRHEGFRKETMKR
jgi:hypothetical protein